MEMYIVESYSNLKYEFENHWLITIIKINTTDDNVHDYPQKGVDFISAIEIIRVLSRAKS
jgi:hypothetical protein